MAPKAADLTPNELQLIDVCGFNLLVEIQALLRHAAQFQREVQFLHRLKPGRRQPSRGMKRQLQHLRQACNGFRETLDLISDVEQRANQEQPGSAVKTASHDADLRPTKKDDDLRTIIDGVKDQLFSE